MKKRKTKKSAGKYKVCAWLAPEDACLKFECDKPDNWDELDGDEKLSYFEQHMKYTGEYSIEETEDPDWYDGIDPNVDFEIEKG